MEQFAIVDLASRPAQKNRDAVNRVPVCRTISRLFNQKPTFCLSRADMRVIREVQVIGARAIEIDPTLDRVAVSCINAHRQCRGAVGRHGYACGHSDPGVARAQGSCIVNAGDRAAERTWGKLCH